MLTSRIPSLSESKKLKPEMLLVDWARLRPLAEVPPVTESFVKGDASALSPPTDVNIDDDAVTINVHNNSKPWVAQELVRPLSFGLPEGRFDRAKSFHNLTKTWHFAPIIPGVKATYTYHTESAYYDSYAASYFGITFKKGGWDCMRHY